MFFRSQRFESSIKKSSLPFLLKQVDILKIRATDCFQELSRAELEVLKNLSRYCGALKQHCGNIPSAAVPTSQWLSEETPQPLSPLKLSLMMVMMTMDCHHHIWSL